MKSPDDSLSDAVAGHSDHTMGYIIETLREHLPSQRSTVSEIHREEITSWSVGRALMVSSSDARRLSSNFCLDS